MTTANQIGVYKLNQEKVYRNGYEVAAWYTDVKVQPGEYPVFGKIKNTDLNPKMSPGKIEDISISCKLPGIIVGSDFSSLLCGNVITQKINEEVGKEDSYYVKPYAHSIARSILEGLEVPFELSNEYHARYTPYIYDGEMKYSAGIFHKESDIPWNVQQHVDADTIILYAYEKKDIRLTPVIAYREHNYLVCTFDKETNVLTTMESFPVNTEEVKRDTFLEARSLYLSF
jgi:hypothetical protein